MTLDLGVVVSWNTEGPANKGKDSLVVAPGAIAINPLNWKLDNTYAPASMNLGSYMPNEKTGKNEIVDVGADAQVNVERGTVVTHAASEPVAPEIADVATQLFGPDGRHASDAALR